MPRHPVRHLLYVVLFGGNAICLGVLDYMLEDLALQDGDAHTTGWAVVSELGALFGLAAVPFCSTTVIVVAEVAAGILRRERNRLVGTELARFRAGMAEAEKQIAALRGRCAEYRRGKRSAERETKRLRTALAAERRRADGATLTVARLLEERAAPRRRAPPRGSRPRR